VSAKLLYLRSFIANLIEHALMSIIRVGWGSFFACLVAIATGIILGYFSAVYDSVSGIIEILRPIPPLAWIPVSLLLFGIHGPLCIVFIGVFFPVLSCTIEGMRSVDREWLDFGKTMNASMLQTVIKIMIPASLPSILNGIKIGVGVGWMCIIAAEMISFSSVGLGYYIMVMYEVGKMEYMLAGMASIGLLGYVLSKGLSFLVRRYSYIR
jgi:NitT/TauT family transport system permease protein